MVERLGQVSRRSAAARPVADGQTVTSGIVRVCEAGVIDQIVTDAALPYAVRAAIDDAGIEVTFA